MTLTASKPLLYRTLLIFVIFILNVFLFENSVDPDRPADQDQHYLPYSLNL